MAMDPYILISYLSMIPAAVIIIILSVLETRLFKERGKCLGYRFKLIRPFNFLDGFEKRLPYAMAMGSVVNSLIAITVSEDSQFGLDAPLWAQGLFLYFRATVASIVCYPLFACLRTRYTFVGAVLCILYSILWMTINIYGAIRPIQELYRSNATEFDDHVINYFELQLVYPVFFGIPQVTCNIVLILACINILYQCYMNKSYIKNPCEGSLFDHQEKYVKEIFNKSKSSNDISLSTTDSPLESPSFTTKLKKMMSTFYKPIPNFRYPTRIVAIMFVRLLVLYWVLLALSRLSLQVYDYVLQFDAFEKEIKLSSKWSTVLSVGAFTALFVTLVTSLFQVLRGMYNYRYHIMRMWKGDKSILPAVLNYTPNHKLILNTVYSGYQVGFLLWGCMIIYAVFFLTICGLGILFIFLDEADILGKFFFYFLQVLSFPLTLIFIFYIEVLIISRWLLQPKINVEDRHRPLNIDNRNLYEMISYYSIFINVSVGVFSCLLRFLKMAFYGIVSVGRIDISIFPRSSEKWDAGFKAYICMLFVDNAHNNPSMRVFAHLLWTKILAKRLSMMSDHEFNDGDFVDDEEELTSSPVEHISVHHRTYNIFTVEHACKEAFHRAIIRWQLAYTLVRNPQLSALRKSKLTSFSSVQEPDHHTESFA